MIAADADTMIAPLALTSTELVAACYRLLLGREPESEAVVAAKARSPSVDALLRGFLECEEFRRRFPAQLRSAYLLPARRVDVEVSKDAMARMFDRILGEWSKLGEEDPYWSVLTRDTYRMDALDDAAKAAFFATGKNDMAMIDAFAGRSNRPTPTGRCLEFGCGVGRATSHLAQRFAEVVAVDISPRNLEICVETMRELNLDNVTPVLLRSPEDVSKLPGYDFLFSAIVLQHNPPPVQSFLLDQLLSKVANGGAFLFQTPTLTPGYSFEAEAYLATPPGGMELHDLPMAEVFRLIAKHDAVILEVMMDGWTGLNGSHTFFGVKPERREAQSAGGKSHPRLRSFA
jgi:SAM-dependent methyltransferase